MEYTDPLYGTVSFSDLEQQVIENTALQRLKDIHQNGAAFLINKRMQTTRYHHSLGVATLLKQFDREEDEVIAGLVHDVSHTAFSHLADQLFERKDQTFHEDHHERFVEEHGLDTLVSDHGYDPSYIFDEDNFSVLERDRPDICADRLDYMLRDLYTYGLLQPTHAEQICSNLSVVDGILVADDIETAKNVAERFIQLNEDVFFDPAHEAAGLLLKEVLTEAMEQDIITETDLFTTDEHVLAKIRESSLADRLDGIGPGISLEQDPDGAYTMYRKHRYVDPPVKTPDQRLTDLDEDAKAMIEAFKDRVPTEPTFSISLPEQ